jgi:hypothetical protein
MAHGRAGEIRGTLDRADAWGWQVETQQAHALLDRELGLLWGLTRRARAKDEPNPRVHEENAILAVTRSRIERARRAGHERRAPGAEHRAANVTGSG